MKLPNHDRIDPQNNKFAMGVENKVTGHSKLDEKQVLFHKHLTSLFIFFFCRSPKRGLTTMKHLKRLHMKKWWRFKEAIRT